MRHGVHNHELPCIHNHNHSVIISVIKRKGKDFFLVCCSLFFVVDLKKIYYGGVFLFWGGGGGGGIGSFCHFFFF